MRGLMWFISVMLVVALAAKVVDVHNDAKNEHQAKPEPELIDSKPVLMVYPI